MPRSKTTKRKGNLSPVKRRKLPAPVEAPVQRYPCGTDVWLKAADYPPRTECLQFVAMGEGEMPDEIFEYLKPIIAANCEKIVDELIGPMGPMYLVLHHQDKYQRLMNFLESRVEAPGSNYPFQGLRSPLQAFIEELEIYSPAPDANEFESDFSTPPTSEDETFTKPSSAASVKRSSAALAKLNTSPAKPTPATIDPAKPARPIAHTAVVFQQVKALREPAALIAVIPTTEQPEVSRRSASISLSTNSPNPEEEPMEEPAPAEEGTSRRSASPAQSDASYNPDDQPLVMDITDEPATSKMAPGIRRQRRRPVYRTVDFQKLTVEMPPPTTDRTIIFRPTNSGDNLANVHPKTLVKELTISGDYTAVRDLREGGLAVDFPAGINLEPLLGLQSLGSIPITSQLSASSATCAAVLSGVHPELTEEEIQQDLTTAPSARILSVKRLARPGQTSWSVKVTFEGTVLPERGFLYGRCRRLILYVDRPLQCQRCARFGHSARVCKSSLRCGTCGNDHETSACRNETSPQCPNCGGPHTSTSSGCPARAFQMKVCEIRATTNVPYKEARQAVTKAAKTYAEVAKRSQQPPKVAKQPTEPCFIPNVAHPRPPPIQTPSDFSALASLFQGLVAILTKATATGDLSGVMADISSLFRSQAPGADPTVFSA